jgi:hypothetical protein
MHIFYIYHEYNGRQNDFWQEVSNTCQTPLLKMDFKDSSQTLGAIAYAATGGERGLRAYSSSAMYAKCSMHSPELTSTVDTLMNYTTSAAGADVEELLKKRDAKKDE